MRISKYIADCGVASRREAERLLLTGKVKVNGKLWVDGDSWQVEESDKVEIDGKELSLNEKVRLWAYHKPVGLIVTESDEKGRKTVFDEIDVGTRVVSIGRLDKNTEGLLLVTNSGELARKYEMGDYERIYEVKVAGGKIFPEQTEMLASGVTIDGVRYAPVKLHIMSKEQGNYWVRFKITEGKNREIRNICSWLGLKISRLKRISYGEFQLGKLKKGEVIELNI